MAACVLLLATAVPSFGQQAGSPPVHGSHSSLPLPYQPSSPSVPDPVIVQTLGLMHADTVLKNLTRLQDFGSRFLMLDSRREIAEWLAGQFTSYGMTDVRLDSFLCYINWGQVYVDTLWQYNVIARLEGASAPDEIYVVGGHYDSYSGADPYNNAPGADDNGSATVATLEVARAMMAAGYQPEATIEFTLFAAEELGLFGSRYLAQLARYEDRNIRYVFNMDMIANNPDSVSYIEVKKYDNAVWAAEVAAHAISLYTSLEPVIPDEWNPTGSDSYPYYLFGFPAIFLQEYDFSPHWHQLSDTVGNCNIGYLTEGARGACATLMEQQNIPYPGILTAHSSTTGIRLSWKGTTNANVAGVNLYRSLQAESGFVKINSTPLADTFYVDEDLTARIPQYYRITTAGKDLEESLPSETAGGVMFAFSDTLLVLNTLKEAETSPDSIRLFYEAILDTIPFRYVDLNTEHPFSPDLLASHKNILWTANSNDYDATLGPGKRILGDFFANGGNMLISAFNPVRLLGYGTSYPYVPGNENILRDYFKVDTANRKSVCMMYRAYPDEGGYDTLRADTNKAMAAGYPGEIINVEVYAPAAGGSVIGRFDSHYPPSSPQGQMQGRPVGLEYMGAGFRTILLGFPLWYIDTLDASAFLHYVMKTKFTHPTAIPDPGTPDSRHVISAWPNPAGSEVTLLTRLDQPSDGELVLFSMQGTRVVQVFKGTFPAGQELFRVSLGHLPAGVYQAVMSTTQATYTCKIIRIP